MHSTLPLSKGRLRPSWSVGDGATARTRAVAPWQWRHPWDEGDRVCILAIDGTAVGGERIGRRGYGD